ncbi:uncharacterized protein LOC105433957 [Pogonomyrmex barbatus]|uniref:Uncharacterized protein LOC105433957 n=1 Tax=Pogonomyrmex barbatus TaxID=144034 RepID=A0A6I9X4Z8_9HYME|nr:uncharacterized protein LOC105433957 [Pogonomyrmex barbatus]
MRTIYLLAFVIFVVIFPVTESGVYKSRQSYQMEEQDGYGGAPAKYYKTNQKLPAPRNESSPHPSRKFNVSAWGIIAIIIGVIVFSTITYYMFLLYPYICKKDESYDIIELTEVNSVNDNVHLRVYCDSNNVSNDVSNNA